jgi:hypothetical protein
MAAIGRLLTSVVRAALLVGAIGMAVVGVAQFGSDEGSPVGFLVVAAVLLVARSAVRRARGPGTSDAVPATILRIWQDPRPGAPAIYWTFVLFDVRGERVKVRLSKSQARRFLDTYSAGDIGRLAHRGETLLSWEPPSPEHPIQTTPVRAFISYERSWADDARYVASFLESRGIQVWLDTEELRAGDELTGRMVDAISSADVFIPVLATSYWTSRWCVKELELAQSLGMPIRPVKVEAGRLVAPPHMREAARPLMDETVYVDLRGRDPILNLEDFAASLVGTR